MPAGGDIAHHKEAIKLDLWDTAGQEAFQAMNSTYFRQADAAIFVYDVTREETLDSVMHWDEELKEKAGDRMVDIVTALVSNKIDLDPETHQVPGEKGVQLLEEMEINFFAQTSAKTGFGVNDMFEEIGARLLAKRKQEIAR